MRYCEYFIVNSHTSVRIFDRWHDGPLRTKDKKGNCLIKLSLFTIKRFDVTEIRTIKIQYLNTVELSIFSRKRCGLRYHNRHFSWKSKINFKGRVWGKNQKDWRCRELNPGHLACEASALPLSYIPDDSKAYFFKFILTRHIFHFRICKNKIDFRLSNRRNPLSKYFYEKSR